MKIRRAPSRSMIPRSMTAVAAAAGAACLFVLEAAAAHGAGGPELPRPVLDQLAQARQDCPSGFAAHDPVQTADLTGDGKAGYILDPHRLTCAGSPHVFGGNGPASIELFVTLPSGEVVHTGGVLALGYQLRPSPAGGPPEIAFETHDLKDRAGSIDVYRWDGNNFTMMNRQSMAVPPNE